MHGTGGPAGIGLPGPWHGHRLAHCVRRHVANRGYYLVEVGQPPALREPRERESKPPRGARARPRMSASGS